MIQEKAGQKSEIVTDLVFLPKMGRHFVSLELLGGPIAYLSASEARAVARNLLLTSQELLAEDALLSAAESNSDPGPGSRVGPRGELRG